MPTPPKPQPTLFSTHVSHEQVYAFLGASHARLGARSPLRHLPQPILRAIAELALWPQCVLRCCEWFRCWASLCDRAETRRVLLVPRCER